MDLDKVVESINQLNNTFKNRNDLITSGVISLISVGFGFFLSEIKSLFGKTIFNIKVYSLTFIKDTHPEIGEIVESEYMEAKYVSIRLTMEIINNSPNRKIVMIQGIGLQKNRKVRFDLFNAKVNSSGLNEVVKPFSLEPFSCNELMLTTGLGRSKLPRSDYMPKLILMYRIGTSKQKRLKISID